MTIRQDAASMFAQRIDKAGMQSLDIKLTYNGDLVEFVDRQELPRSDDPETTETEHKRYHTVAWTRFWMNFYREFPEEQPDRDQMTEQFEY